jgi:hypothetical protein
LSESCTRYRQFGKLLFRNRKVQTTLRHYDLEANKGSINKLSLRLSCGQRYLVKCPLRFRAISDERISMICKLYLRCNLESFVFLYHFLSIVFTKSSFCSAPTFHQCLNINSLKLLQQSFYKVPAHMGNVLLHYLFLPIVVVKNRPRRYNSNITFI